VQADSAAPVSLSVGAALGIATTLLAVWPRGVASPAQSALILSPWTDARGSGLVAAGVF
jgi:hypothetical protein